MSIIKHSLRSAIVFAALLSGMPANAALNGTFKATGPSVTPAAQSDDFLAKKGADDRPGHQRRGRGRDDGPNHAFLLKLDDVQVARRGADDRPGHIRRSRGADDATTGHQHRGRGADDATGHDRRGRGSDDSHRDDHGGRRS